MKTSISKGTTSARNWNVYGLLHDNHHVRWHFHRKLRHLRGGKSRAKRTGWARDLGHFDNLFGDHSVEEREYVHQFGPPSAAQVHRGSAPRERSRQAAPRCAAVPAPAAEAQQKPRAATRRALPRTTGRALAGDGGKVTQTTLQTTEKGNAQVEDAGAAGQNSDL